MALDKLKHWSHRHVALRLGFKAYLNLPIRNIHWFPIAINERLNYNNFAELNTTTKAILESNEVTGIGRPIAA
jgi:hypothetical protein